MVLRLDPTIPLVWRDPTTLQLGVDPVRVVIPDVDSGLERLVAVLAAGVSESGYPMLAGTLGVTTRHAEALREAVGPYLLPPPVEAPRLRAAVLGETPLAHAIARLLDEEGLRTSDLDGPDLVVLVAHRVIPPSEHRGWLQRDIPHLAVVASDTAVTVGHVVEPGATACLHCLDLQRRDADPAWPAIAAQLTMLPPPAENPLRTASAAVLAARVAVNRMRRGAGDPVEFRVDGDGEGLTARAVTPHPDCRCAAPPESDWAPAGGRAAPHPTRRATASAVHA